MMIQYNKSGEYLEPNLTLPEEPEGSLGKYGRIRKSFLREHRSGTYSTLLLSGKLKASLLETDRQAREMMETLMKQYQEQYPAPDKAKNQMGWVGYMNSLRQMAEEVVLKEIVYS
ncbi:MAG: TnpV protein [Bacillota bacterium]